MTLLTRLTASRTEELEHRQHVAIDPCPDHIHRTNGRYMRIASAQLCRRGWNTSHVNYDYCVNEVPHRKIRRFLAAEVSGAAWRCNEYCRDPLDVDYTLQYNHSRPEVGCKRWELTDR